MKLSTLELTGYCYIFDFIRNSALKSAAVLNPNRLLHLLPLQTARPLTLGALSRMPAPVMLLLWTSSSEPGGWYLWLQKRLRNVTACLWLVLRNWILSSYLTAQEIVRMVLPEGRLYGKEEKKRGEGGEMRNQGHPHPSMPLRLRVETVTHLLWETTKVEKNSLLLYRVKFLLWKAECMNARQSHSLNVVEQLPLDRPNLFLWLQAARTHFW